MSIANYYEVCMTFVKNEIQQANGGHPTARDWKLWVNRWSRFSAMDFLTSSYEAIVEKLKIPTTYTTAITPRDESKLVEQLKPLKDLLPLPRQAIIGYLAYNYTPGLHISIVELLRDDLGQWWTQKMHSLEGGLSTLPWAFTNNKRGVRLGEFIDFGMFVTKVKYEFDKTSTYPKVNVSVRARNDKFPQRDQTIEGDVCIVTLPLNIIRQLAFEPPLTPDFADAVMHINCSPSTKILLQCKARFWEKENIFGGFSFTNLPIGQLHYPSNADHKPKDGRGILMCYTWKEEGLLFGSQPEQMAIAEAVEEVSLIHPEIKNNFEVGAVQAWYSDPTSQGGFALLRPFEIQLINEYLLYPYPKPKCIRNPPPPPLYFAGEAISYTTGWIRGALESGLRAAYQFYCRNENFYETKYTGAPIRN